MPLSEPCEPRKKRRPVTTPAGKRAPIKDPVCPTADNPEVLDNTPLPTRAESARVGAEYDKLDSNGTKTAFEKLDGILQGLAGQVVHTLDQVIPHLDTMHAFLSQRGRARKKVLKEAGLPSWPAYANQYAQKLDCSFRTIQDHLTGFRRTGKSGPSRKKKTKPASKPLSLMRASKRRLSKLNWPPTTWSLPTKTVATGRAPWLSMTRWPLLRPSWILS